VLELASTTFFSIFLAIGAFAAGLVAFFLPDTAIWIQAVVAIAVAMAGVVIGRPFLRQKLRRHGDPPLTPGVHGGFVGQRALGLNEIGDDLHPVTSGWPAETWLASPGSAKSRRGAPVIVSAVRGTTLAVRRAAGSVTSES
jgi:membrane protein implicated in regulation of membrane protease activity